eukprot:2122133-Rhodomonas_salina.1
MPKQVSPSRMLLGRREIGDGAQNALPERSSHPGQCLDSEGHRPSRVRSCDERGCKAFTAPVERGHHVVPQ